jgi:hypothetical protein
MVQTPQKKAGKNWWHVIWTTFLARTPADPRGGWSRLTEAYSGLLESYGAEIVLSDPLDVRWQNKPNPPESLQLSPIARQVAAKSILELAKEDRVAGDTEISAMAIDGQSVQIVLACPSHLLHQRVGRLKSRTATLLSFERETGIAGKGTWSRGFWWARLTKEPMLAAIEDYVRRESERSPL